MTPGRKLVVAVSGGPDSVCLLHLLSDLSKELGIKLHVAHLNHMLRGADADADADYVTSLAEKLGIPATIEARDVKAWQQQHRASPEEAARLVRYEFLAAVAAAEGADAVAVGHTADDNVETILMNLIRGSGTRGLRGLQPRSQWPAGAGPAVIRPLLALSREETAAYCRRHRLNPRTDATNASLVPFRNRVRHELLPLLREYNPRINEALLRMAGLTAEDLAFIEGEVLKHRDDIARREGDTFVLNRQRLLELPVALQRQLLRGCIEDLVGNLVDIEAQHIEAVIGGLEKPSGKRIGLSGGLGLTVEYDRCLLGPDAAALAPLPPLGKETELVVPGNTLLAGWEISTDVFTAGESASEDGPFCARLDLDKTGDKLAVRRRREGDRFQPLGMKQPKKLGEFMIDARIPQAWRPRVPVVTGPDGIVWVAGWRIDERCKVTPATRRVLRLRFTRR